MLVAMPVRRTFRSTVRQRRFEASGWVVLDGFPPSEVQRLRSAVLEAYAGERRGFHSSMESRDHDYRERLHRLLEPAFRPLVEAAFDDHVILTTAALVKWPGDGGAMGAHQDWTFVDEARYRSLNLWCPLEEVTGENGPLAVLAGSQRDLVHLRPSPHLPPDHDDPTRGLGLDDLDPLRVGAGDVVAVDHGLLHASPPNRGTEPRVAIAAAVAPADAAVVHHHCRPDGSIERFSVPDPAWFRTFDFGDAPTGVDSEGTVAFTPSAITTEGLRRRRHGTFLDADVEAAFVEDGYAVVDLLDGDEVDRLRAAHAALDHDLSDNPDFAAGFHTTLYDPRPGYRRDVLQAIEEVVAPALDRRFVDHHPFFANFMVKLAGGGPVPRHADWTFVDEDRFTSATVWCALADQDEDDGALGVVVGSHRHVDFVRPVNHRDGERHAAVPGEAVVLPLRAGQAVVTDSRTVHFSVPNRTAATRVVAACVVAPRTAPLHHWWVEPDGRRRRLEVGPDFYCTYALGEDPQVNADVRSVVEVDGALIG
jgi:ectoine hydroxylase-related dioxygenase (phytanoyl-CoA dioxygenase family)